MGMFIESLHVKKVGPFNKLDVQFNPKMNVIVGTNGVGKTSLLRCIADSLTNNSLEIMRFRQGATIKMNGVVGDKKYTYGAENLVDVDQAYRHLDIQRWQLTPDDGHTGSIMHKDKDYNLLAIGAYRYFDYSLINGMTREGSLVEERRQYRNNNPKYLEATPMPNIKQWMINRYFQIDKPWAIKERNNWNAIISKLGAISPKGADFNFVRIERDLEPIFSLNGSECYLEELSSGFKSVLSIILNIVDWIEGVNEGDSMMIENAEGTVLIDEIDAHLHPSWQSTVLSSLRQIYPKLQFIVTTHSPNVVMSSNAGEVLLLNNENGYVNIKPDSRAFGVWQFNDILTDIMQSPNLDRIDIIPVLNEINRAYDEKNVEKFEAILNDLSQILNPNDAILKVYNLKLSELKLKL